ncbi:hypothetical protein [Lysinibacillus sp. FSL P2-0066]|uniref:hypothetical protein n=1 Tax=Lysinibacillus sp. FSL P2-0066 TaxID=2921720 RepID=UPI0030DC8AA0
MENTFGINISKLKKEDKISKIKTYINNSSLEQIETFEINVLNLLKEKRNSENKSLNNDLIKWSDVMIKNNKD